MTKKQLKLQIKTELKSLAKDIRAGKNLRKPKNQIGDLRTLNKLDYNRDSYRHKHIAYCLMFNNTPYHMIECPRDDNKPHKYSLESYKKDWKELIDEETICPSA